MINVWPSITCRPRGCSERNARGAQRFGVPGCLAANNREPGVPVLLRGEADVGPAAGGGHGGIFGRVFGGRFENQVPQLFIRRAPLAEGGIVTGRPRDRSVAAGGGDQARCSYRYCWGPAKKEPRGTSYSGKASRLRKWDFLMSLAHRICARSRAQRLAYFAKYLEHADPLVAEDVFLEFGHVPYDVVAQAAAVLPAEKLRRWIVDTKVPGERKGFYGLALGLTAQGDQRAANLALLKRLVEAPTPVGGDFRAGFDGILGGYLVAKGAEAIEAITKRILANPQAAVGDARHAQRALRFYFEFGPAADRPAIAAATEHLLDRPAEAAEAITDLARWRQWSALARVAELYEGRENSDVATRRAVVGYLLACPMPQASEALRRLRQRDPEGVAAAEKALQVLGSKN